MGWESSDVVRFDLDGSMALVSCLSGGYKFAFVLHCVGLVKEMSLRLQLIVIIRSILMAWILFWLSL